MEDTALQLREVILNTREPLVLRNFKHNWKCFQGTLQEWCREYDATTENPPEFERISLSNTQTPQWERKREIISMTTSEFLQQHKKDQDYWTGLNYKRAHEVPDKSREGVDFSCFGFPHAADNSSYWLSSRGANTPAHYDTYGCNIVVQVYGSKAWLLFPPEAELTSTRIPYEESSVYAAQNLYAPDLKKSKRDWCKVEEKAFRCILEPNDVLIVPRHWWHYVEALEISLSVNYWIPLEVDVEAQLEECIVKFLVESFIRGENEAALKYMLNPNQLEQITEEADLLAMLKHLCDKAADKAEESSSKKSKHPSQYAYQYLDKKELQILLEKLSNISHVSKMSKSEFWDLITKNSKRFNADHTGDSHPPLSEMKEILINSICSPSTIACIRKEFLKHYANEN